MNAEVFVDNNIANVLSKKQSAEFHRALEQTIIREFRRVIVLRSQHIDRAQTKLIMDCLVDVNVKIESDRHLPSS